MRFPDPSEVAGPASMRVGSSVTPDTSGIEIAQGVSALARGVGSAASSLDQVAARQLEQQNTIDLSRAEAARTAGFLDIQNAVAKDNNFGAYNETYTPRVDATLQTAASLIRDPRMRERWLADAQVGKLKMADAWQQRAVGLQDELNQVALASSLEDNFKLMADPTVPVEVRNKARADIAGSLHMATNTGLITPGKAAEYSDKYIKGADQALAGNLAELDILSDPQRVMAGMAIPTEGAAGSILDAQMAVDGGALAMDPELAGATAHLIGDANFPAGNAKEINAYLADPQKRLDYSEAAVAHLSDRYNGDLSAVVIAMDPNGGTTMADRWVQSGHADGALTPKVRDRYEQVMSRMMSAQPARRVPIETDGSVDLGQIDGGVLKQFEKLQSHLGIALPVTANGKSTLPGEPAITINVSALPNDARARLIEMASAYGFTGIGVGKDTMTLDTGTVRSWGPDGNASSIPAWAKEATALHDSGDTKMLPMLFSGVAPEYAALTFDQRMALYGKAKAALADRNVSMRTSLETVAENAPAALAATGKYDGDMPTATDFVRAWGADEGIQRWHSFQTSVDTARQTFGFTGATNDEIMAAVHAATPMSSGNNAALEQKRFAAISAAADAVIKQRAEDPAGYVLNTMPAVQRAFADAQQDKSKFPAALKAMEQAQIELGISDPKPLPKGLVTAAVTAWKDDSKAAPERIGAVAGVVFASNDPVQQDAIFSQLVGAGLPQMLAGPLHAMRRNDTDAAQALMRAALIDPAKLEAINLDVTDKALKDEIGNTVFAPGGIGSISYGLNAGTADNMAAVGSASEILFRDAKLSLMGGQATDATQAVKLAAKHLFGDDQVLQTSAGGGMQIPVGLGVMALGNTGATANVQATIPHGADPNVVSRGFANLTPLVRQSLRAFMIGNGIPGVDGEGNMPLVMSVDNYVDNAMNDGFFTDAGGFLQAGQKGYVYYYNDGPVLRPDGQGPMIFTLDDVLAASNGRNFSGGPDNRFGYR